MKKVIPIIQKILNIFFKTARNGEKQQDIEMKKIDIYNQVVSKIIFITLLMCVLSSIFPKLSISEWWFDLFEKLLNKVLQ